MKAPAAADAGAVSRAEARRQMRQQNAEWREFRKSLAGKTVPQQSTGTKSAAAKPANNNTPAAAKSPDNARLEVLGAAKTGEGVAKGCSGCRR